MDELLDDISQELGSSEEVPLSPCVISVLQDPPTPLNSTVINDLNCNLGNNETSVEAAKKTKKRKDQDENTDDGSREVYLITYSRADVVKVAGRDKFGEIVTEQFNRADDVVEYWGCSAEIHRTVGIHFHLAIKLKTKRRFKEVRNRLKKLYHIDVDFQFFANYHQAYTYMKKYDTHFVVSENHPPFVNPPRTTKASKAKLKRTRPNGPPIKKKKQDPKSEPPSLTTDQVCKIVRDNNIGTELELYAFVAEQAALGKTDLEDYFYRKPSLKHHADIRATVNNIKTARDKLKRKNKSVMEIFREAKELPHDKDSVTGDTCDGKYFSSALEVLNLNNVTRKKFSDLVLNALTYGRGKGRNLMILGETNCAKSFMLMPLTKIFNCFMTPSKGNYNWVSAPSKEIIFLNDLRYDQDGDAKVMPWSTFLNFLEGATINVSMPKNRHAEDFEWSKRQPVFATAEHRIVRIVNNELKQGETNQMDQRWRFLNFKHQFLDQEVNYDIIPCGKCFAELILDV